MKPYLWKLGIDPGFGMSGLVLLRDGEVVAWALHKMSVEACPVPWVRAMSLASGIMNTIERWVDEHKITELHVAIEVPVYTSNPKTYLLQTRLLQELQSGMTMTFGLVLNSIFITEVNPSTSKKLLTSNVRADKKEMIAASPFAAGRVAGEFSHDEAHTLADAYAHALSAGADQYELAQLHLNPWTLWRDSDMEDLDDAR